MGVIPLYKRQKIRIMINEVQLIEKEDAGMQDRLRFRWGDLLAIGLVAVAAVLVMLCFLPGRSEPAAYAQVYQDGKLVHVLPLDQDGSVTVAGKYTNVVTVRQGKVAVTDSDCPGGDCVGCGWIDSTGRVLVCLPNGVEVRVVAQGDDVDFVVG